MAEFTKESAEFWNNKCDEIFDINGFNISDINEIDDES